MGLGEKIKATVKEIFLEIIETITDPFEEMAFRLFKDKLAGEIFNAPVFKTPEGKKMALDLKEEFTHSPGSWTDVFTVILTPFTERVAEDQLEKITGVIIDKETPVTQALTKEIKHVTDLCITSNIAGIIGEIAPTTQLGQIGSELRQYMDYSGITQVSGLGYGMILQSAIGDIIAQEMNAKMLTRPLDMATLRLLKMRGIIGQSMYDDYMKILGYKVSLGALWMDAGQFYPGGQDFIRYAVRDVFNPDAVETGKLMSDFPTDILPYAAKAGMNQEILEWEWMSHWQLPSPRMGYEMLHRGLIDKPGLRDLLRVSDYAPGWIENLISISYNPLTRVDARRFYETGVLNDAGYLQAMKDIGYSDHNAGLYVEWAKRNMAEPDRDLTKAQVMSAYKLDLMSRGETIRFLLDLGYDTSEADLMISLTDEKERLGEIKDELEIARWEYAEGVLTNGQFMAIFEKLKLPITKAKKEQIKATRARRKMVKMPSKEDVLKWHKDKTIDEADARNRLRTIGYRETDIDLYLGVVK